MLAALVFAVAACGNSTGDASPGSSSVAAQSPGGSTDAGGPNSSPGVTDTEIHFSSFGTRTNNPLGTCVADCFDAGVKAYFEYRNSQGGVFGRKLVLSDQLDDQFAQNQQRALEIISNNDTFAAFSATALGTGWKDIADAGIPLYVWAIDAVGMKGQQGIFGNAGVQCLTCFNPAVAYGAQTVNAKKVAVLGYGIAQQSKDCVALQAGSIEHYSAKTGQAVAYTNDTLTYGLPNGVAPEVTAMKDAGVDFVLTCVDNNGVKTLEQEMARQGMGDVPVLLPNAYDQSFISEGNGLYDGDLVTIPFRPFEADAGKSDINTFKEWMDKTGQPVSELAVYGWANADLAYQGIKAAGGQFTRESVIAATNKTQTAWSAGDIIVPIDWSRQHEPWTQDDPVTHGYKNFCFGIVKVKDGAFELVGDKDKPFNCWDLATDDVKPTSMDFG